MQTSFMCVGLSSFFSSLLYFLLQYYFFVHCWIGDWGTKSYCIMWGEKAGREGEREKKKMRGGNRLPEKKSFSELKVSVLCYKNMCYFFRGPNEKRCECSCILPLLVCVCVFSLFYFFFFALSCLPSLFLFLPPTN